MVFSLCDFCNAKSAVLHCTADSANLCLFCDRHVHLANILSLKHTRWWICYNCGAKPASVCSSKNGHGLIWFCQSCACDLEDQSHTTCSTVEEFSGCPSANMLASVLGLNNLVNLSSFESCLDEQEVVKILDGYSLENELCEQLVEMGRRDLVRADVDGAELRPQTPPSRRCGQMTPFSSLLLLPPPMDLGLKVEQRALDVADEEEDLLWDYNPTYDPSLVCLKNGTLCKFTIFSFALQTLSISLAHKSKHTINPRYSRKGHVGINNSDEFIPKHQKMTKKISDLRN